jgi:hydroxymethylglutaryl-CoA reductase (NADPH)
LILVILSMKKGENELQLTREFGGVVPQREPYSRDGKFSRVEFIEHQRGLSLDFIAGHQQLEDLTGLKGNIENFIGMSQVPTGILGPVVINGENAKGGFYIPLATSEGTLVASYGRGARACRESGVIRSVCLMEGVQRSPVFKFNNLDEVLLFANWINAQKEYFNEAVRQTSKYAQLQNLEMNIEGNQVILDLEFYTGDAAGQNMVTFASQAICTHILEGTPVKPLTWYLESNFSGDKKATSRSFAHVRGKRVSAEIVLKKEVVENVLKTTSEKMYDYWKTSFIGASKSGAIGAQGHYSNGLAALFIACGQDAACVSEASVGITRMELTPEGDLYCAVTLPNLIVGTVGGGTGLPTQRECLEIMDCYGEGKSNKLAEICGALCLSGEISIIAALSAGQFSSAHKTHGRKA